MTLVFDAEPIIAFVLDEKGSDAVESHLTDVRDRNRDGWMNVVTLTEIHYIISREASIHRADLVAQRLEEMGLNFMEATPVIESASRFKRRYGVALGDAFALATAESVGGPLLVGGDGDYDTIEEEADETDIERFRVGSD